MSFSASSFTLSGYCCYAMLPLMPPCFHYCYAYLLLPITMMLIIFQLLYVYYYFTLRCCFSLMLMMPHYAHYWARLLMPRWYYHFITLLRHAWHYRCCFRHFRRLPLILRYTLPIIDYAITPSLMIDAFAISTIIFFASSPLRCHIIFSLHFLRSDLMLILMPPLMLLFFSLIIFVMLLMLRASALIFSPRHAAAYAATRYATIYAARAAAYWLLILIDMFITISLRLPLICFRWLMPCCCAHTFDVSLLIFRWLISCLLHIDYCHYDAAATLRPLMILRHWCRHFFADIISSFHVSFHFLLLSLFFFAASCHFLFTIDWLHADDCCHFFFIFFAILLIIYYYYVAADIYYFAITPCRYFILILPLFLSYHWLLKVIFTRYYATCRCHYAIIFFMPLRHYVAARRWFYLLPPRHLRHYWLDFHFHYH